MSQMMQARVDQEQHVTALETALGREGQHYEALLALATEQGRLMTGTDLEAVGTSASALADGLAVGDALRQERERLTARLTGTEGDQPVRLSVWLSSQPDTVRRRLEGPVVRVREVGQKLLRQNEKNRRLASFCLDLVEEEARILRRCFTENAAGCYDGSARTATDDHGCMLHKKA